MIFIFMSAYYFSTFTCNGEHAFIIHGVCATEKCENLKEKSVFAKKKVQA